MDPISSFIFMSSDFSASGEQSYTTAGTYSWTCPPGVSSVCAVAIGPGFSAASSSVRGGAGGGLGYKNDIPVVPGVSYTVVVGGASTGVSSYFIDTSTVRGGAATTATTPGTFTGDSGGNGGSPGSAASSFVVDGGTLIVNGTGGGASGGYTGTGGAGDAPVSAPSSSRGSGALGAGGTRGGNSGFCNDPSSGSNSSSGGSGGYAKLDGTVQETGVSSGAGSTIGGAAGATHYGAGGGGSMSVDGTINPSAASGRGAVRIIWGQGRSFPGNAA